MIVGPVVLLVLLGRKRRILPKLIVVFAILLLVIRVAVSLAVVFLAGRMHDAGFIDTARAMTSSGIWGLVIVAVLAAIWVPYFLLSKRVRNTFLGSAGVQLQALPAQDRRRPRIALVWAVGALVAISLVVLGALIWRDSTLSNEQEGLYVQHGDTKTYTDPDYGYSFDYPADWVLQQSLVGEDAASYSAPGTAFVFGPYASTDTGGYSLDMMGVVVHDSGSTIDESMLPEIETYLESYLADYTSSLPGSQIIEALSEITVSGLNGFKATITDSFEDTPLTSTLYWLFGQTLEYDLMLQAKTANMWALDDDFAAFTASFRPGPED